MPQKPKLAEERLFEPDVHADFRDKNYALADLLRGRWSRIKIVEIKRIEIGKSGWYVIHRK
jgi:hypothetical protein